MPAARYKINQLLMLAIDQSCTVLQAHAFSFTYIEINISLSWDSKKIVQWLLLESFTTLRWQVWTNLTVILADTQSIAINARAVFGRNLQPQGTIIARTLTSPWHSTKSSTNSSIWSTNRWAVTLARRLRKVRMALACAGYTWSWLKVLYCLWL